MSDDLARIAAALERLAPAAAVEADWLNAPAYVWQGAARPVATLQAPPLDLLKGIDAQKTAVTGNVTRLAMGHAAHDMLLWGSRGMGKSALLRAAVAAAQAGDPTRIALVQVATLTHASVEEATGEVTRGDGRAVVIPSATARALGRIASRAVRHYPRSGVLSPTEPN